VREPVLDVKGVGLKHKTALVQDMQNSTNCTGKLQSVFTVVVFVAIENWLDFVLESIVNFHWVGWWRAVTLDIVPGPGGEAVNMENRVLMH
jgi:hypothetical protein